MRRARRALLLALAGVAVGTASAHAAQPLSTGFNGGSASGPATSEPWLAEATFEGASMMRLNVLWSTVAPTRPKRPADPADPAYRWSSLDAAVQRLSARRIGVLLTILDAPRWAEGPGRPPPGDSAPAGSWRPNATALREFAAAAARRYSGEYPDPLTPGATLPRVRYWQAWNEPNLWLYLTPQWTRRRGAYRLASAPIYRALLNGVYAGVKRVRADDVVLSAGTAPYGDLGAGGRRVSPVRFLRSLLCLGDRALRPLPCPHPAHLDAIAHHPYSPGGPESHAVSPDDAAVPDIARITRVLRAAERSHRVLPAGRKGVWVTEISWDSAPPDPEGVPVQEHARWVEKADYVLWRQRVGTVLWLQIRDSPPRPSSAVTYQAGMFFLDGTPKPAADAFRFPFVVVHDRGGRAIAWGKAPAAGPVAIQRRTASGWKTVARLVAGTSRVFVTVLTPSRGQTLRALSGTATSLPWLAGVR